MSRSIHYCKCGEEIFDEMQQCSKCFLGSKIKRFAKTFGLWIFVYFATLFAIAFLYFCLGSFFLLFGMTLKSLLGGCIGGAIACSLTLSPAFATAAILD